MYVCIHIHLLHFDGPEFKLGVSVTPQCGHREVPAWLERLIQFSGLVLLTLPQQGWVGQVGGVGGRGEISCHADSMIYICRLCMYCSMFVCVAC